MRRGPSTGEDFQTGQDNTIDPKHMQAGIANKGYNSDGKGVASGDSTGSDSGKDVKESVEQAVVCQFCQYSDGSCFTTTR